MTATCQSHDSPVLKRQRSQPRLNGTPHPRSKRQRLSPPIDEGRSQTPAAFWDNLSEIGLTRRSLRELDRRNTQPAPGLSRSSRGQLHRRITRRAVAELKKYRYTQSASDFLRHCAVNCLKDIKRLARLGGPDLSELRGCSEPPDPLRIIMSSSQSRSRSRKRAAASTSRTSTSSRKSRPYDRHFQQNLIDGGVYPNEYEYPDGRLPPPPDNWEEINQRLAHPRPSLSPSKFSEEAFRKFKRADAHAFKEKQITTSVIPIIEGDTRDGKCVAGGVPLTNLDPLTDGTLAPGNPDLFYGARPEQLDRRIRNELSGRIVPSTQEDLPMAPNFFLAAKGPNGTAAVARGQACYDGALGSRGIHSLQSYEQDKPIYDNNAYTITSTYNDGQLKMYTSHPSEPANPEGHPEYYMNQIKAWAMTSDLKTFRQGATAYRNAKDWTKDTRDRLIDDANGRVPEIYTNSRSLSPGYEEVSVSTARPAWVDSDTSADELALEHKQTFTSSIKRPRREFPKPNQSKGD